jgi:hypothetical protein
VTCGCTMSLAFPTEWTFSRNRTQFLLDRSPVLPAAGRRLASGRIHELRGRSRCAAGGTTVHLNVQ